MKKIVVTGGAGFAGSNLAIQFKQNYSDAKVVAFDNLKRRGSELILSRLRENGIEFAHGDVRIKEDLFDLGEIDLLVDCAAEPSVLAGREGSPHYVINTNLNGTINSLELARTHAAKVIFLSTSRVYPVKAINDLNYREEETRFSLDSAQDSRGASEHGIAEGLPLEGSRTIYGASKLCSEHLLEEYIDTYGVQAIINRCGVLTGPWQMGKVDQGVVVLWLAKHIFNQELGYFGYGGTGKQVRDILHIQDLFDLLNIQLERIEEFNGEIFNVGGGTNVSVSLRELTQYAQRLSGNTIPIKAVAETRAGDLISYISDYRKVSQATGWQPKRDTASTLEEISRWIVDNRVALEPILA